MIESKTRKKRGNKKMGENSMAGEYTMEKFQGKANAPPTASQVLARISMDPAFKGFAEPDFDPAAFASLVVDADSRSSAPPAAGKVSRAESTMAEVGSYITAVEGAIQTHIGENRETLLGGVGGIQDLQAEVAALSEKVADVKRGVQRASRELGAPFAVLEQRTGQLRRVAQASSLLKRVLRVQMTSRKLRALEPHLGLHLLPLLRTGQLTGASAATSGSHKVGSSKSGATSSGASTSTSSSASGRADPLQDVDVRELAKAAEALHEIEALVLEPNPTTSSGCNNTSSGNINGNGSSNGCAGSRNSSSSSDFLSVAQVAVVAAEAPFVAFVGDGVRVLAGAKLREGMTALNQADIGGALQVFFNLGNLRERVALAVAGVSTKAIDRLTAALDPRALAQLSKRPTGAASNAATASASGSSSSSVTNPGAGDSSSEGAEASATRALRRRCREHAEDIAAVLFESAIQVWSLQRVLAKKTDPTSHARFLDVVMSAATDSAGAAGAGTVNAAASADSPGVPAPPQLPLGEFWSLAASALQEAIEDGLSLSPNANKKATTTTATGPSKAKSDGLFSVPPLSKDSGATAKEREAGASVLVELYPALRKALLDVCAKLDDATGRDEGSNSGLDGGSGAGLSSSSSSSHHAGSMLLGGEGISAEPLLADVLSRYGVGGLQDVASLGLPRGSSNSSAFSGSGNGGLDRPGWAAAAGLGPTAGLFASAGLSPDLLRAVTGVNPSTSNNSNSSSSSSSSSSPAGGNSGGNGQNDNGSASTNSSAGAGGNSGNGGGSGGGARAHALLKALSSCEARFLEKSMAAVMKPVDQMFPSHEGYANAIPSKHDLMAFMRVVQGEVDRAVHGGGEASLAPLILQGVARAVVHLSQRVETMVYQSPAALAYGRVSSTSGSPVEKWEPTLEQGHNLQLAALLARLHEHLGKLPDTTPFDAPAPNALHTVASNSSTSTSAWSSAHVSSGGLASAGGGAGGATGAVRSACTFALRPALKSLEGVCRHRILRPMVASSARALEKHLAKVHAEHFGQQALKKSPSGSSGNSGNDKSSGSGSGDSSSSTGNNDVPVDEDNSNIGSEEESAYLRAFQESLTQLETHHLSKLPRQATFVKKALAELAQRLTRSFVSHSALVRPLSQKGRTRLTQDMAMFEMALSPLIETKSDLGRSGSELHAFKQVLFLEDDSEPIATALTKLLTADLAHPEKPLPATTNSGFSSALRPSTLLHHAFSRYDCPTTLSPPCDQLGVKPAPLVEWLVSGAPLPPTCAYASVQPPSHTATRLLSQSLPLDALPHESGASREAQAWAAVADCLDAYAQRCSATSAELSDAYGVMEEQGALLVERYLSGFLAQQQQQQQRK